MLPKVVSMAEERTNIRIEEKIHCHLRYGYFVMVNEIVMTTVEIVCVGLYLLIDDVTAMNQKRVIDSENVALQIATNDH
jgi:hypothetical protein